LESNPVIRLLFLAVGVAVGALVCAFGGVILRVSCRIFNYGGSAITKKHAASSSAESSVVEFATVEAGPYTSPATFAKKQSPTIDPADENFVPIPTILGGAQIFFITLLGAGFSTAFLFGYVLTRDLPNAYKTQLSFLFPLVNFGIVAIIHATLVGIWLKTSWPKSLILTFFCGVLIAIVFLIAAAAFTIMFWVLAF
jgi:hypothetical protein